MDFDCIEIERRLTIGFNEHLSLTARHRLVLDGIGIAQIMKEDPRFKPYTRETRDVLHWLSRSRENSIIWYGDKDFPDFRPLRAHLPYMLFCRGEHPNTNAECVAIVGTRHATYQALQQAFRFGYESTLNGINMISGFAEGIDQSAMRGALEGRAQCIGVLACGHDVEYPNMTAHFRDRIVDQGGCIISRFAPKEVSYKSNFLSRNMVIAAYCDFAIAVQSPKSSGTLNTCDYVLQMGKELYVGSEGVGDRFVQVGTTGLFNDGAKELVSLGECDRLGDNVTMKVVDVKDFAEISSSMTRFGDRIYMVTKH